MVISAGLFSAGDILAQTIESDYKLSFATYEPRRTLKSALAGGILFAPLAHGWFNIVDRLVVGSTTQHLVKKVLYDQLAWTPVINSAFLAFFSVYEGERAPDQIAGVSICVYVGLALSSAFLFPLTSSGDDVCCVLVV